ncbi:MAG: hypothetical protein IPL26_15130 [Leptospiraceae bacterium]|nr:hypothetical protein [Leptospiraceae bacterium]
MKFAFIFLLILYSLFNCSNSGDTTPYKNTISQTNNIQKETNHLSEYSNDFGFYGISTNSNIIIQNRSVIILLKDGIFQTNSEKNISLISNNQINGKLFFKDVTSGEGINGITVVAADKVTFTPEMPLKPAIVYQLVFIDNFSKKEYKENIFISAANVCNPEEYISKVPVQKSSIGSNETVSLPLQEHKYQDTSLGPVSIIAWDHLVGGSFYFKIQNRSNNAKYRIVNSFGIYNIPGHECELYFQRDSNSPFPTWTDNNYGSKVTKVTDEDTVIYHPITKEFYKFSKTYLMVKVFNESNVDITSVDNAILTLEQTDTLYGLPVSFNSDEESSLLAYLNHGNNNSYSMVLGGLIVGIFAFFLSRRFFKREEDI